MSFPQIKKVIVHLGNLGDAYSAYATWEWNKTVLMEKGVLFSDALSGMWGKLHNGMTKGDLLNLTAKATTELTAEIHTVAIYCGRFSRSPLLLSQLKSVLRKIFPEAVHRAFYSLRPQCNVRRAELFWNALYAIRPSNIALNNITFPPALNYASILALLQTFEEDYVHIHVGGGTQEDDCTAQDVFWKMVLGTESVAGSFRAPFIFCVPWEFLLLRECCCAMAPEAIQRTHKAWLELTLRKSWSRSFSLFSTEQALHEYMQASGEGNAKAAATLGLVRLWEDDPVVEELVGPQPALTPEGMEYVLTAMDAAMLADIMYSFIQGEGVYFSLHERSVFAAVRKRALAEAVRETDGAYNIARPHGMQVSVLTSTYNHVQFIEKNIQSVIAQQRDFPIAHIIADDGSNDGTQEIILKYARQYPHIYPLFQRQRTYGKKNVADLFDFARSPYVAICEGDDYYTDPCKLQKQVEYLEKHPECSMCFHQVDVVYEDGTDRHRVYPPLELMPRGVRPFYYLADLFKANFIQTNSVMYRWRFKEGLPEWFRSDLVPGDWYWHILHAEVGKIGFMDGVMSVYRRHKQSLFYSSENPISSVPHRIRYGMNELETYHVINEHFAQRYERVLVGFSNNVLLDFLKHAHATGDDSLLQKAGERYPRFMEYFLRDVKVIRHRPKCEQI